MENKSRNADTAVWMGEFFRPVSRNAKSVEGTSSEHPKRPRNTAGETTPGKAGAAAMVMYSQPQNLSVTRVAAISFTHAKKRRNSAAMENKSRNADTVVWMGESFLPVSRNAKSAVDASSEHPKRPRNTAVVSIPERVGAAVKGKSFRPASRNVRNAVDGSSTRWRKLRNTAGETNPGKDGAVLMVKFILSMKAAVRSLEGDSSGLVKRRRSSVKVIKLY
jgi:hypothetical protein